MVSEQRLKSIATDLIVECGCDVEWMTIGEVLDTEEPNLSYEELDTARHRLDDLVRSAIVTVTWE